MPRSHSCEPRAETGCPDPLDIIIIIIVVTTY